MKFVLHCQITVVNFSHTRKILMIVLPKSDEASVTLTEHEAFLDIRQISVSKVIFTRDQRSLRSSMLRTPRHTAAQTTQRKNLQVVCIFK